VLLAGAVLHDIGKTRELLYATSLGYSDRGRLLGHLVLGVLMVSDKIATIPGFPPELADRVLHLIVSHHGTLEWGSPRTPATPEAIALHYIDNMDAKLNAVPRMIDEDSDEDSNWTAWQHMFQRRMYKR